MERLQLIIFKDYVVTYIPRENVEHSPVPLLMKIDKIVLTEATLYSLIIATKNNSAKYSIIKTLSM